MQRREFITLLGGVAAAWPRSARAQQPARMRRIGVLMGSAADDPESPVRLGAFLQGLQESGWALGRNMLIDTRWGAGKGTGPVAATQPLHPFHEVHGGSRRRHIQLGQQPRACYPGATP